jgi:hypothetical protein
MAAERGDRQADAGGRRAGLPLRALTSGPWPLPSARQPDYPYSRDPAAIRDR